MTAFAPTAAAPTGALVEQQAAAAPEVVGVSSATTDGADTSAANLSAVVGVNSSSVDGQDVSAAFASAAIAANSATFDSGDISVAAISVASASITAASNTTDGADECVVVDRRVGGGGYDDRPSKRSGRYVARVGGRLVSFKRKEDAIEAIQERDIPEPVKQAEIKALRPVEVPAAVLAAPVDIGSIRHAASAIGERDVFNAALRAREYEVMLGIMLRWKEAQDDEDDIEALLLAA